jgi:hypothetical protein
MHARSGLPLGDGCSSGRRGDDTRRGLPTPFCIRKFSEARIAEIAAEFVHSYSGLDPIIRKLASLPKEFPVEKLKEITGDIWLEIECKEDVAQEYPWAGGYVEDPKGFAKILLECGILFFKTDRKAEPVVYDLEKRPEITGDTWLATHPVFWPALALQ